MDEKTLAFEIACLDDRTLSIAGHTWLGPVSTPILQRVGELERRWQNKPGAMTGRDDRRFAWCRRLESQSNLLILSRIRFNLLRTFAPDIISNLTVFLAYYACKHLELTTMSSNALLPGSWYSSSCSTSHKMSDEKRPRYTKKLLKDLFNL